MDMLRGGWGPGMLGNGMGVATGGGSSYDAATEAIAAAFTTPPTTARKNLIDAAVVALKSAGVWTKLDALYLFAAADSQAAKINWVQPGTYNCTEVNAPSFAADQGFTGASTKYLDSNFNPTTAPSPKFVQNSASVFGWSLTNADINGALIGNVLSGVLLFPRFSGAFHGYLNDAGSDSWANTDSSGLFVLTRRSSTSKEAYRNTTSVGTAATVSAAPYNSAIFFLRRDAAYWTGQIAAGGIGSQLSAADNTALYNALAAYMAGLATDRIAAAFTTPPTAGRKTLIQNCVTSLMQAGVWDKLDALHVYAAADSQAALINWKAPGTYNGTLVNAPAFAADRGFTAAATKYLDTGFNPTSASSPKWTLNDAGLLAWIVDAAADGSAVIGVSAPDPVSFFPREPSGGGTFYAKVNTNTLATPGVGAATDGSGLSAISRTGTTALEFYKNGASIFTTTQSPSVIPNEAIRALSTAGVSYLKQTAVVGFGGGLSDAENTALYNALRTYLTGVGVP